MGTGGEWIAVILSAVFLGRRYALTDVLGLRFPDDFQVADNPSGTAGRSRVSRISCDKIASACCLA